MDMARWFVIAVHIAIILPASIIAGWQLHGALSWPPYWAGIVFTLPLGLVLLVLQLRLSLAFASGERPRHALWLVLVIAVLVYLPTPWLGWLWLNMQICVIAAVPMVLGRWPAAVVVTGSIVSISVLGAGPDTHLVAGPPILTTIYVLVWTSTVLGLPAIGLFGSARLVRMIGTLRDASAAFAAVAVDGERLRIARDLHDLLGQSLSAISLKGDLAIRLLSSDPSGAREEIASLTGLARDTARGIRAVTRDEHILGLHEEADGAAALLAAAGVQARIDIDLHGLPLSLERLFAWAVREGVANTLLHSEARTCSITGRRQDGKLVLAVVNDGVSGPEGEGSGLAGLAERARGLSGSVSAQRTDGGGFLLQVEVPEGERDPRSDR